MRHWSDGGGDGCGGGDCENPAHADTVSTLHSTTVCIPCNAYTLICTMYMYMYMHIHLYMYMSLPCTFDTGRGNTTKHDIVHVIVQCMWCIHNVHAQCTCTWCMMYIVHVHDTQTLFSLID